jgi:hypothetical protein
MPNKRNAKRDEPSNDGGIPAWMTTYSDLMTLMLSFFVILVSFATFEQGPGIRTREGNDPDVQSPRRYIYQNERGR